MSIYSFLQNQLPTKDILFVLFQKIYFLIVVQADITGYECDHELFDVIKLLFHCNTLWVNPTFIYNIFSSELTLWMQLARVECDHNHCASFSIHFPTVTWHWSPLASPSCAHTTYLTYSVLFCRKQEKFSEI